MPSKEKAFQRLCRVPSPTDFRWDEWVSLAEANGFEVSCRGGSHHMFHHLRTGLTLRMSRTHPSGLLKLYQVRAAVEALLRVRGELT